MAYQTRHEGCGASGKSLGSTDRVSQIQIHRFPRIMSARIALKPQAASAFSEPIPPPTTPQLTNKGSSAQFEKSPKKEVTLHPKVGTKERAKAKEIPHKRLVSSCLIFYPFILHKQSNRRAQTSMQSNKYFDGASLVGPNFCERTFKQDGGQKHTGRRQSAQIFHRNSKCKAKVTTAFSEIRYSRRSKLINEDPLRELSQLQSPYL